MDFLKTVEKAISDIEGVEDSSQPPRYWYSIGNYVLNKIMSGSFFRGIPQGRITGLAGPSGSGKSFIAGNLVRAAQQAGAFVLVIDSENALDNDFMQAIGVDTSSENYMYRSADTIPQVVKIVSAFLKAYKEEYGDDANAPQVLIVIDSLDMLMTDTESDHFEKGDMKGDQGQRAKQLKAMLRTFVQGIKHLNLSMVVTTQVYAASQQQLLAGEGLWKVNDAIRFALSQIILLTKLKLKDAGSSEVHGIRMKCEGLKTRFTKPFQTVTIEVPYDTGMDPYSGLMDSLLGLGIIERKGAWYYVVGTETKFQSKDFATYADNLLTQAEAKGKVFLQVDVSPDQEVSEDAETPSDTKQRRKKKVTDE